MDLKELGDNTELPDISPKWPPMTKPVIGAINGAAVTGGLEIALYCDILIASEQARFAYTLARVGLLPTWGLSVRLPQKVGVGMARRMSMTGDYLSATDALRAGLVTQVVPHDDLLGIARQIATSIVGKTRRRCTLCSRPITASTTSRTVRLCGWRRTRRGRGWPARPVTTSPPAGARSWSAAVTRSAEPTFHVTTPMHRSCWSRAQRAHSFGAKTRSR